MKFIKHQTASYTTKIVLFDGDCNLCNAYVKFIIERDDKNQFRFASLQSNFGYNFLKENNLKTTTFTTVILVDGDTYYTKSEAFLRIISHLKGLHWTRRLFLVPGFARNAIYHLVSRNRHRFFSKKTTCMIPTTSITSKFITTKNP